jgi:hypothetical protein
MTEDFLNSEILRINKTNFNLDKLKFSYWKNKIENHFL